MDRTRSARARCLRLNVSTVVALIDVMFTIQHSLAGGPVDPVNAEEARAFLWRYAEAAYHQSPTLVDLYSDQALVRITVYRGGVARTITFRGKDYKAYLGKVLTEHGNQADASQFKGASVERRVDRLVIRAQRYAHNRCYWDRGYVVVLGREGGAYRVLEEHVSTQPESSCPDRATAAAAVHGPPFDLTPADVLRNAGAPNVGAPRPASQLFTPANDGYGIPMAASAMAGAAPPPVPMPQAQDAQAILNAVKALAGDKQLPLRFQGLSRLDTQVRSPGTAGVSVPYSDPGVVVSESSAIPVQRDMAQPSEANELAPEDSLYRR